MARLERDQFRDPSYVVAVIATIIWAVLMVADVTVVPTNRFHTIFDLAIAVMVIAIGAFTVNVVRRARRPRSPG